MGTYIHTYIHTYIQWSVTDMLHFRNGHVAQVRSGTSKGNPPL